MRVTRAVAATIVLIAGLTGLAACGSEPEAPPGVPDPGPTGPSVTGTYAFVEKDAQTLCDYLDADGARYHLIYGGQVGHGVLGGGQSGAPLVSFIYLGQGDDGFVAGVDPATYGARTDVIAVGEKVTAWGALTAPAGQDPCQPYDQVLTVSVLRQA